MLAENTRGLQDKPVCSTASHHSVGGNYVVYNKCVCVWGGGVTWERL